MNKCILCGNLTKDFTVSYSQSGTAVGRSGMALNRGKNKDGQDLGADFVNLVAFGNTAQFFEKYGTQGRKFLLECHVQTGSYTNKEGQKVYTTDFVVDKAEFVDSKPADKPAQEDGYIEVPAGTDSELPFV